MKTKDRPLESHTSVISSFMDFANVPEKERELLKRELKRYIETRIVKGKWCHPFITKFHTDWYREFYRIIDGVDPYKLIKDNSNIQAKQLLKDFKSDSIRDSVMLTIIGNKIDFGACMGSIYDLEQLKADILNVKNETFFIDQVEEMLDKIKSAKNVLYLFDNNGEMIFDTLLLDFIVKHVDKKNVFLVGKERPMLNDVTVADLKSEKLDEYGLIVSTGSDCFGLHEEDVSDNFKKLLKSADLIIAKGQAYLEFFSEYNFTNVFHVLRVKQEIVGDELPTLMPGMNVVMKSTDYAGKGVDYVWS